MTPPSETTETTLPPVARRTSNSLARSRDGQQRAESTLRRRDAAAGQSRDGARETLADADHLRILRVSTDTYPEVLGGGALHAHEMSKRQAELGHDVTLLTSDHGDDGAPREEQRAGYTLRRYREVARPFGNSITPSMVPDIRRLAATHDVVHAHSHLYFSSNVAAAFARLGETPLVLTNHGLFSQSAPKPVQKLFMHSVARFTFNSAARVFCYTETDRDRLHEHGVSSPILVIHNGIDCDRFRPGVGETRGRQVLFVGRLKKSKGVARLVRAVGRLVDELPDVTLAIVGEGPRESYLRGLTAELGIGDRVEFRGRVPNENLPSVYAESAVFALSSDAEGLPRTVLESLACETPVVTSALPQLESLVDGVGKTVERGSIDALETSLRGLLTDRERRREFGRRGRKRVVADYSWEETVRETTAAYRDVV